MQIGHNRRKFNWMMRKRPDECEPGTPEYADALMAELQLSWDKRDGREEAWGHELFDRVALWAESQAWKYFPEDMPYGHPAQMLRDATGATIPELKEWVLYRFDAQHWDKLDRFLQVKGGGNNNPDGRKGKQEINVDNINIDSTYTRPTGTSEDYAVRKLRKEGLDTLADDVRAGKISANAAMIECGFRPRMIQFSERSQPEQIASKLLELPEATLIAVLTIMDEKVNTKPVATLGESTQLRLVP